MGLPATGVAQGLDDHFSLSIFEPVTPGGRKTRRARLLIRNHEWYRRQREITNGDRTDRAETLRTTNGVAELADIAGPRIAAKSGQGFCGEGASFSQKVLSQE